MVIWAARARADLKAIHDSIAKDAPLNAKTVARELRLKADTLTDLPQLGRGVPELNDAQLREIPCYSWHPLSPAPRPHLRRHLVHKRRQLGAEEITGR